MNVTLTPAFANFIRRKVEAGEFGTAEEVVCEGLRLLQQQDQTFTNEVRRKIDEGWAQASSGQLLTPGEVEENLAARKQTWRSQHRLG